MTSRSAGSADMTVQDYLKAQRRFVACLREHGEDARDPDDTGAVLIPTTQDTSGDEAGAAAEQSCAQYSVPAPPSVLKLRAEKTTLTPAQKKTIASYAACMQSNGAPDFPDPQPNGQTGDRSWDQASADAQRAASACAHIIGDPETRGPGVG